MSAAPAAVAAEDPLGLHELLTLKDIVGLALSSDGRQLAFVTRAAVLEDNSYDTELFVVPTTTAESPRRLGHLGPILSIRGTFLNRDVQWAADDQLIVSIADLDGTPQVWAWDMQGGPPRRLTSAAQGVAMQSVVDGGHALVYTTMQVAASEDERDLRREAAMRDGMVLSMLPRQRAISSLENTVVWGDYLGQRGIERYVNSALGVRFEHWRCDLKTGAIRPVNDASELKRYVAGYDEIDNTQLFEWGIRSSASRLLRASIAPAPEARSTAVGTINRGVVSPDGRWLARVVTENRARIETVVVVGAANGGDERERYRVVGRRLTSLAWAPDSETLFFMQSEYTDRGFESQLARLRAHATEPEVIYAAVNARIRDVKFDFVAGNAFLVETTSTQPDQLVAIDLKSGARRVIYDPNPQISERKLPTPILIPLKNRFGVRGFAYVVPPLHYQPGSKYPMVVVTYRASGFLRGGTGNEYPIYPLASAGFAVLALDVGEAYFYRRPGEFGIGPRELSGQATLEEAVEKSIRLGFVDRDRVAITGLSYGAGLAWYAMIKSQLFKVAIVSDSGIDPMPLYVMGHNPLTQNFPVPPVTREDEAQWRAISPALNAKRIRAPILINDCDAEFWKLLQTTSTLTSLVSRGT